MGHDPKWRALHDEGVDLFRRMEEYIKENGLPAELDELLMRVTFVNESSHVYDLTRKATPEAMTNYLNEVTEFADSIAQQN